MTLTRLLFVVVLCAASSRAADLRAGYARRDITPREATPMWGYGDRHDAFSQGVLDPLYADVVVLEANGAKLAIAGLDLGRSPGEASLESIRRRIQTQVGIVYSIIAGSHTHHGPVVELTDAPGKGQGKFDATLRYNRQLEDALVEAIVEADGKLQPVRLADGVVQTDGLNRNRHTKADVKPLDRDLAVLRLDTMDGKPLALLVNFTAHPTSIPSSDRRFSADYVGALKNAIAKETGAGVVFLQGAEGDQSTNRGSNDYKAYGERVALEAIRLSSSLSPQEVKTPMIEVREQRFRFDTRLDYKSPLVRNLFSQAFFPELVANYLDEYADGVRPRLTVALLNKEIAFVGGSGEFFAAHSIRLKERARVKQLFFCGLANGYHQYFPTIEGMAEGGYGASASEAPAPPGAGELLMNTALTWLYEFQEKLRPGR